jgi:hypothetical protein
VYNPLRLPAVFTSRPTGDRDAIRFPEEIGLSTGAGTRLGHCKTPAQIRSGGMADVHAAATLTLDRRVALNKLFGKPTGDETRAAIRARSQGGRRPQPPEHPHHPFDSSDGAAPLLTMAFPERQTLPSLSPSDGLPRGAVLRVAVVLLVQTRERRETHEQQTYE